MGEIASNKLSSQMPMPAYRLALLTLWVLAVVAVVVEFSNQTYDWDIDHELYFGNELLRGNLIWTQEFHDKAPVLQMVFGLAALFGGLTPWKIISLAVSAIAVAFVWLILPKILISGGSPKVPSKILAGLAGPVYVVLASLLPGGLTHINSFAASMSIIATVLVYRAAQVTQGSSFWLLATLASFAATFSISFRPYFLPGLALAFLWSATLLLLKNQSVAKPDRILRLLALMLLTPTFGFTLNAGPYLISNRVPQMIEGLNFTASLSFPFPALDTLFYQANSGGIYAFMPVFVFAVFAISIWPLARYLRQPRMNALLFGIIPSSTLLVGLTILSQRWWPHYSVLFSWYFALTICGMAVGVWWRRSLQNLGEGKNVAGPQMPILVGVALLSFLIVTSQIFGKYSGLVNDPKIVSVDAAASSLRFSATYKDESFLAPESMSAHWKLNEPRHGFPHSAHTRHILNGWWLGTPDTQFFSTPKNLEEYCGLFNLRPVDNIILSRESRLQSCFETPGANPGYRIDPALSNDEVAVWRWSPESR